MPLDNSKLTKATDGELCDEKKEMNVANRTLKNTNKSTDKGSAKRSCEGNF